MKIYDRLFKPYTKEQRIRFIIDNNDKLGYEIRETETSLEAWGYTEEEKREQEKQRRNQEIDSKIDDLYKMALPDLLQGNAKNIEIYKEVIESLANNKEELNN